jgi:hypothetical protein
VLGVTLWLVVAIGLLATVFLDAAATFGHATLRAAADHATEGTMHDAVADYQNRLRSALAHDPAPSVTGPSPDATAARYAAAVASLPNPVRRTYPAGSSGSAASSSAGDDALAPAGTPFTLAYEIAPTTLSAPACSQSGSASGTTMSPDGPDAVAWLQCNGFVAESRMSLRVVVRVLDANGGATLARREQLVTLRLFGEPPYSAVTGRKDATAPDPANADALAPTAHEGDVGGDTVSGVARNATSARPAGGTLIHLRYECHDGAGSCANAAPPDPDDALRANATWANGNVPPP